MEFPFLHGFVNYLHQHPHMGGFFTFLIAFAESLPLLGAVIPGSVTMTAVGALIGSGTMPLTPTLIWAVTGAFCGDYLSYWLGAHYNERLRTMWPFRKHPEWLSMGETFFHKHGGKSVVIGRFFGPVRSAVPLIAGLLHMKVGRFVIAALPSAILWSLVYIGPGIVVGALSLGLPPATATKFILAILALVAFGWIFFVLLHIFFKKLVSGIDKLMSACWRYLAEHHSTHWIMWLLCDPRLLETGGNILPPRVPGEDPLVRLWKPYRQLTLLVSAVIFLVLFGLTFVSVLWQVGLSRLNEPLFELFRSLRNQLGDKIMAAFTLLGDGHAILIASLIILAWLLFRRYFRATVFWIIIVVLGLSVAEVIKHLYYFPRPPGLLLGPINSSFPSGHTFLAVAFFGFLAALISQYLPTGRRKIPFLIAAVFIAVVGLSRLYLGAHWLTDVVASLFLALACVLFVFMLYRRKQSQVISPKALTFVTVIAVLVGWAGYGVPHFRTLEYDYTLYWPTVTIDTAGWWQHRTEEIPLFLVSRLDKPREVLNVQWLGSLDEIKQSLIKQGWQPHAMQLNLKNTFNRLSPRTNPQHLPVLPTLYQNRAPALVLTKTDSQNRQINLAIWKSNVTLLDNNETLWLGSIYYYKPRHTMSTLSPDQIEQLYQNATQQLIASLQGYQWKTIVLDPRQQPPVMRDLYWDGVLLLIRKGG
ncbi:MAG TPA: VTT domain-containing protein [Gammaproteobacteria bacterium]|nr:VTT domain-containing protein [Gammaproteobacteria bacterium]